MKDKRSCSNDRRRYKKRYEKRQKAISDILKLTPQIGFFQVYKKLLTEVNLPLNIVLKNLFTVMNQEQKRILKRDLKHLIKGYEIYEATRPPSE